MGLVCFQGESFFVCLNEQGGPEDPLRRLMHSGPMSWSYFFFAGAFLVSFLVAGLSVPFLVPHFAMVTSFCRN